MSTHELKSLTTRLNAIRDERADVLSQQAVLLDKDRKLANQERQLQLEIDKLKAAALVVTEHAIVRYMQRVYDIDLEQIKREILGTEKELKLPNGTYPVNGHKIRVKNGAVVTVLVKGNEKD